MMNWKSLSAALVLGLALATPHGAHAGEPSTILNVSYDVSRELFADLNPVFEKEWKAKTGKTVTVEQSHGGSSKQARAVLEGLQADVVTFNQVPDVQVLHDKGDLVAADWESRFPDNASPFHSLPVFLVRKGNPKNIHDWSDLVKPGVQVIFPNPKTSGNGRYTYLAATAYALDKFKGDQTKANEFAKALLANVPVFDTGGRAATTTFTNREIGDVLITFEAEAYGVAQEHAKDGYEVVTPPVSLLAEFPVAVVDKVADKRGSRPIATAYLDFLYTPDAQAIIARHFYRIKDGAIAAKAGQKFPDVKLISVDQAFGGWEKVNANYLKSGGFLDQVFVGK